MFDVVVAQSGRAAKTKSVADKLDQVHQHFIAVAGSNPARHTLLMNSRIQDEDQDVLLDGSDTEKPVEKNDVSVAARFKISPVTLTVFSREYEDGGTQYWTNLQRAYTEDDGENFEYTNSLRPQDLRKASRLLEKAADQLQGFTVDTDTSGGDS